MAAELKWQLELETSLVPGGRGEFTVWLGDQLVAEKRGDAFPSPAAVVEAVREALGLPPDHE